jgi:hypothetical protein
MKKPYEIPEYILAELDMMSADIAEAFLKITTEFSKGDVSADDLGSRMNETCMKFLMTAYFHGQRELNKQVIDANEVIKFYGTYINWAAQIGNQYNTTGIFKIDRTTNQLVMECGERAREYMKKWCLESDKANREK